MDFSLLQAGSRHFLLRDILALKRKWVYYLVMVIDPFLRFAWIFYAIFTHNTQHSTIVSLMASFAEVSRRGMWTIFRVENEHCANVAQYKASRDIPLPYHLGHTTESPTIPFTSVADAAISPSVTATATGTELSGTAVPATPSEALGRTSALEEGGPPISGLRNRATTVSKKSIVAILAEARKQDFVKKRRPSISSPAGPGSIDDEDSNSSDEEGDVGGDSHSLREEREEVREAQRLVREGRNESDD